MALAYPPVWFWGLVLLAPLPLVWLSWFGRRTPLTVAFWCAIGVSPWWALAHIWVARVSAFGLVPLVVVLSACTGLAVWAAAYTHRRLACSFTLWPVMWVATEFFRGEILAHGYAWYFIAHPMAGQQWLTWPAAVVGTYGVSLLVTLPSVALIAWFLGRRRVAGGLAIVCIAWPLAGFVVHPWPVPVGSMQVGVVQTNVPQSIKIDWSMGQRLEDWQAMRRLIAAAGQREPDVIVLPEAMSPGWTLDAVSLEHERDMMLEFERLAPDGVMERYPVTLMADELIMLQGAMNIPILIGGPGYKNLHITPDETGRFWFLADETYNSVFLLEGGRAPTVGYDKVALTPFGEYMPYISAWPWLERKLLGLGAAGMSFELDRGHSFQPIELLLNDGRAIEVATPVCFEATMPSVCRRLVGKPGSAEVMMNLTNDGWFGSWTPGREHHMLTARWRCIELGVPMIRSANTGICCAFDQQGRVIGEGVVNPRTGDWGLAKKEGTAQYEIPLVEGRTIYARTGDVMGWGCLVAAGGLVLCSGVRGRSIPRAGRNSANPG